MNNELQIIKDTIDSVTVGLLESLSAEIDKANKIRDSFYVEIKTLEDKSLALQNSNESDLLYYRDAIENKRTELDYIQTRLDSMGETKKIIDQLDSTIETKESLLKDLTSKVQLKNDEFAIIQSNITDSYGKLTKTSDILSKEIDAKQEEINHLRTIAIPTINQLDARKKELDKREEDLKIVEDRLRAVYRKNGLNFRI